MKIYKFNDDEYIKKSDVIDLIERIAEVAQKVAPDYPKIKECKPTEQLYAIECAYIGTDMANQNCHKMIKFLTSKLNMTDDEYFKLCEEI